jgi:uncharacterized protein
MTVSGPSFKQTISRRNFMKAGVCAGAGLALYSGAIERHWVEESRRDIFLSGLPEAFDGFRVAHISDIHMDEFTEPLYLRDVVRRINRMNPDAVFLTGDYVTHGIGSRKYAIGAAWQCANVLNELHCRQRFAALGNHDVMVGDIQVAEALNANGIHALVNSYLPIERGGSRFWIAGVHDPVMCRQDPEAAIPPSIRNVPHEPVILLSHAPDYADQLLNLPPGQAVSLMLSGHTHGGQIRMPFLHPIYLPGLGYKYLEGWFQLGRMQLYVNRGIGAVGLPFRFNCPPEISLHTLRSA